MTLRESLLAGGKVPKGEVTVTTTAGVAVIVEVRGLTQIARGRLMQGSMRTVVDEDGEERQEVDLIRMQPSLIIESAFDPATGQRLFTEEDREELGLLSASYLDPIVTMASKLSGLSKDAVVSAEGN